MWNRAVWLIWALALLIAITIGYLLATPTDRVSFGIIGLILLTLSTPFWLRWHHVILLFSWNAYIAFSFLPGSPYLWMLATLLSLTISVFHRSIEKQAKFIPSPSISWPLLFLGVVVLITAKFRGGIGLAALGSEAYGGKKYVYIFGAILGYFALTAQAISPTRAKLYTGLFLGSGLTAIVGNLAYIAGPSFYFLFALFPADFAATQAAGEESLTGLVRISGLTFGCVALYSAVLAMYGIRGTFNLRKPWRLALVFLAVATSLLAGFRSSLIAFIVIFALLFYLERLHRTKWLPITLLVAILLGAVTLPFVSKMPLSVQRAFSLLPIKVDPIVRQDAANSTQWRLDMWNVIIPQIPEYFFLGKGYAIDPSDLYLTQQLVLRYLASSYDNAIVAGDYHNGPLTVLIPFGVFGAIAVLWFIFGSLRALYRNYKFGNPALERFNAMLLAYFLTRVFFFFFIYGSFSYDLVIFVGIIGFSVSLNNGIAKPVARFAQVVENPVELNGFKKRQPVVG